MKQFQGLPPGLCRRVGGGAESRLLAERVSGQPGERLAELGSGCGETAVRVALTNPCVVVDCLEYQEILNIQARKLATVHGVANRVRIIQGDVRTPPECLVAKGYAQVFCNPPFFLPSEGRIPPDEVRATARFERMGGLTDFINCAARLLMEGGVIHLVHRPLRLVEIFTSLQSVGCEPFYLIPVQNQPDSEAVLVLISARKGGRRGELTLASGKLIGDV